MAFDINPFIAQLMQYLQRMPNQGNYNSFLGGGRQPGGMQMFGGDRGQRSMQGAPPAPMGNFMQGAPTAPAPQPTLAPPPPALQSQPGVVPTPSQPIPQITQGPVPDLTGGSRINTGYPSTNLRPTRGFY